MRFKPCQAKPAGGHRNFLLVLVLTILTVAPSAAFAQGAITGTVANYDLTTPADGEIRFFGFIDSSDNEIRIALCDSAGYAAGRWDDDFRAFSSATAGQPYDYFFINTINGEGFHYVNVVPSTTDDTVNIILANPITPATPTSVAASAFSTSSMLVSWTGSTGLTYHVYRRLATSNGSFFRVDNVSGDLTDTGVSTEYFVDNTLDGVSSYDYLIVAEDAGGRYSAHSDIATGSSSTPVAPAITSIDPDSGQKTGGTAVDIYGSHFDPAGMTVAFDGNTASLVIFDSPSHIRVNSPAGLGLVDVITTNNASSLSDTLPASFTYFNTAPVLATIGSQSVVEGDPLTFPVSATDADLDSLILTAENVPTNATFTDNYDGTGTFNFNPDFTQSGIYDVLIIASDGTDADSESVQITVTEAGNQTPVLATIGSQSVVEGDPLTFPVSATDADLDSLILTAENVPTNATFTDNYDGTGTFNFNPDFTQSGIYDVLFIASDGVDADSESVQITVTEAGNQTPVLATIGSQSVIEGDPLTFPVSATDADLDSLILTAENVPTNATFTDNYDGTGTFSFNPDFTQADIYDVLIIASDGVDADSESVQITVTEAGNQTPVLATIGSQSVVEGDPLTFPVSATDADLDSLILTAENVPTNATFTDNYDGTGTFNFNPDFTQAGIYDVLFIASDGTDADSESVQITVTEAGNQTPVLATIGSQSVIEGDPLTFPVSATDADLDSLILTAENVPTNATFTDNYDGTGTFNFNPDFTQAGIYNVLIIASDGTDADSESVQITVTEAGNQTPVLATIGSQSVVEGDPLTFPVSATDADLDSLILTAENVPTNATFTDNYDGTGTFNFNPDFTQSGIYDVLIIASDGVDADSESVQITVTEAGNQTPVLATIGSQSIVEGDPLTFPVSATDADLDSLILTAENVPTNATFTDNYDGTGTFNFNPDFTQAGIYDVLFIASDGVDADSESVQITVTEAGNQNPVLDPIGNRAGTEGQNLNFLVTASDPEGAFPGLTSSALPANATFTDNGDGTAEFDWMPGFQQAGVYLVTFTATDDSSATDFEQITITIADAGNQPPVLSSIGPKSVIEGESLSFGVSATDPDGTTPAVSASPLPDNATFVDNGNGTGNFDFDPDFTQSGVYYVTFVASDGVLADSEIVEITVVDAGNQAPVLSGIGPQFVTEGYNLTVNVSATDADGDSLILSTSALPTNSTFVDNGDGSGVFSFDPDYTQSGIISIVFRASDNIATDSETVFITIYDAGNQDPILDPIGPQTVIEGDTLSFPVSSSDPEGDTPGLSVSSLPPNATFLDNGDGTGVFDFNPDFTQSGIYNITFYATDDSTAVDSELVVITVQEAGNQFPVLDSIGARAVDENAGLNFTVSASDPDVDSLIMSADNLPANATFTDNFDGTGVFDFNPDFFQADVYYVTFIASDGSLADSEVVEITVNNVNRPPVLDPVGDRFVDENSNLSFTVTSSDPDLTSPALSTSTLPSNATFVDNGDGTGVFDFNPSFYQEGTYDVTFYAGDGMDTDSETVVITANHVNQLPVLDPIGAQFVTEGYNLNVTVTATDLDSSLIVLSAAPLPPNATFVDNGDGSGIFDFNPDYTQADIISLTFYAYDGEDTDSELVFITIAEAGNQTPVLATIGSQSVVEGDPLTFPVSATDADLDSLILTAEGVPTNATFTDNYDGTGTFNFNPDFTQSGIYDVLFIASDGTDADSESVQITVTETGNQTPVLATIGSQSVVEGDPLTFPVSATDADLDSLILTAENVPTNATFTDNYDGTGTFNFNPDFTQSGIYDVLFIASDGVAADSESVQITVTEAGNQTPVLATIGSQSVIEGDPLTFPVSATDADLDSLILTAENVPTNATFTDNYDGTGTFNFNPDFTQAGIYDVLIIASDGTDADSESVQITVTEAGNQTPVLATIGSQSVVEGDPLTFPVSAIDADLDSLILTAENVPTNATFTDNYDGTGTFNFNPDFTQAGIYDVLIIASDGVAADSESVQITVTEAGNQTPVLATIGSQSVVEGDPLTFPVSATDADLDSLILTAENVPTNATFTDNYDGTGTFNFNPDFTQAGIYDVLFIASDGTDADSESVQITVTEAGNQTPVLATIGSQSVIEGDPLTFPVSATDADLDSLILTAENVPTNATFTDNYDGTGTFNFNPDFTQAGIYNVLIIASDGTDADSESVQITVTEAGNQTPVLATIGSQSVVEGDPLTFPVSATDADLDSLILTAENVPTNATFTDNYDGTGTFNFNPDFTQAGIYDVLFIASDGTDADSESVQITVTEAGNQTPVLATIGSQSVIEGDPLTFPVSATDADLDSLILTAENVPTNATFTDNYDGTGTFNFNPDFTQAGIYDVLIIASDGADADSESVQITVTDENRAPVADAGSDQVDLPVGSLVTLDGTGSFDPDGDSLSYGWVQTAGAAVTLSDPNDSIPTFTSTAIGSYDFELTVSDGSLFSTPDTVQVTVVNVAPPQAIADLSIAINGENIELSWSSVTLDTSGFSTTIANYVIYRDTLAYFTPEADDSIGVTDDLTFTFVDNNLSGADVVGDTSYNYFYVVVSRDIFDNQSDISNRVGEFDYQIVTTATTDFNIVCVPFMNSGITTADELIDSIGRSNVLTVNNYQPASQSFESRFAAGFGVNFSVVPGGIYQVNAAVATVFSVAGQVPTPGSITYPLVTTGTTSFSFLSIPFERETEFQTAQDVLDNLPGSFNTLNNYVEGSQSYESRFSAGFGVNFRVRAGMPYQANAAAADSFPGP